jgi:hypothetical protein
MALCHDDITTFPIGAKKVVFLGYFHFFQAPFGPAAAKKHCKHAPF